MTFNLECNPCKACCGGTGFIQQEINGDGVVFLSAVGTIVQKVLKEGEKIIVDTDCIVAWAPSVDIGVQRAGGIFGMLGGGEGIFNTVMTGPGLVVVQVRAIYSDSSGMVQFSLRLFLFFSPLLFSN